MRNIDIPRKRHNLSFPGGIAGFSVPKVLLLVIPYIILFSCATLSPVDGRLEGFAAAPSPEAAVPQWRPFAGDSAKGLAYCRGKLSRPRMVYHALRVDLREPALAIITAGGAPGGSAGDGTFLSVKVSGFVRGNNLLAGINALPFEPVSGREGEPRTNAGIVISGGITVSPPRPGYDALVFYSGGGAAIEAQSGIGRGGAIENAVGGFQRILENNEPVPRVLNLGARHPRSAAGLSSGGRFLYLLVIDGRRPGSAGATEAETAYLLRALGASDGINFDGGGSSALALRFPGGRIRVVNTPIHRGIPGRERAVAGCLGVGAAGGAFPEI